MKKVMIVEDDPHIRETFRMMIESEGYAVVLATDGQQALDILQANERPCLIFLDLNMSPMNGWQFLEERAKNTNISAIPVVVTTAATLGTHDLGVELIKKPLDYEALLNVLRRYCNHGG